MQEVQIRDRRLPPAVATRMVWGLGSQRRLPRRWEWLTFMPVLGFLPQTSHILATETDS
jgi:hypothetical protein